MNNVKFFVAAGILALAGLVGLYAYLPAKMAIGTGVKMADFPLTFDKWEGKDIVLSQSDYDILETKNLIMREYTKPGVGSVLLYIIYSEDNRKVSHPPEVCYTGGGSTITEKGVVQMAPGIQANKMITETTAGNRQYVAYWYKAGDLSTAKYMDQQFRVVWRRTFGKKTSAAMIRVSAEAKEGQDQVIEALIKQFCAEIEPIIVKYVP